MRSAFWRKTPMIDKGRIELVAPCGIDCGSCELYTCRDDAQLLAFLLSKGVPQDKLPCDGCRNIGGHCPVISNICATYACASERKVDFCFECDTFPCGRLHPAADRADVLPHNLKVFNLCSIKNIGVEGFIEKSSEIKQKYYKGKMRIGEGPQ